MRKIEQVFAAADRSLLKASDGSLWAWGNLQLISRPPEGADPQSWCSSPAPQVGHGRYAQERAVCIHHAQPAMQGAFDTGSAVVAWADQRLYMLPLQVQEDTGAPLLALPTHDVDIVQWFAGLRSIYGVTTQGQLYAWGADSATPLHSQQQGPVASIQPLPVAVPIHTVSTGMAHALALDKEGQIWAWGANAAGQLGTADLQAHTGAQRLKGGQRWIAAAAGASHSLAIDADGQLWGWGSNHQHQLSAQWDAPYRPQPQKIAQPAGLRFASVHAGLHVSAAITEQGQVWTWGMNSLGQLGQGHTARAAGMFHVQGIPAVRQLSIGQTHMLALDTAGTVWAWGDNRHGNCQSAQTHARVQMHPHAVAMPSAFTSSPLASITPTAAAV